MNMFVRVECNFLLVHKSMLMMIEYLQLVINLTSSLGKSQAGTLTIANLEWFNLHHDSLQ